MLVLDLSCLKNIKNTIIRMIRKFHVRLFFLAFSLLVQETSKFLKFNKIHANPTICKHFTEEKIFDNTEFYPETMI